MRCPACSSEMKPLFVGYYCPKDCDRKTEAVAASEEQSYYVYRWQDDLVGRIDSLAKGLRHVCYDSLDRLKHDVDAGYYGSAYKYVYGVRAVDVQSMRGIYHAAQQVEYLELLGTLEEAMRLHGT